MFAPPAQSPPALGESVDSRRQTSLQNVAGSRQSDRDRKTAQLVAFRAQAVAQLPSEPSSSPRPHASSPSAPDRESDAACRPRRRTRVSADLEHSLEATQEPKGAGTRLSVAKNCRLSRPPTCHLLLAACQCSSRSHAGRHCIRYKVEDQSGCITPKKGPAVPRLQPASSVSLFPQSPEDTGEDLREAIWAFVSS